MCVAELLPGTDDPTEAVDETPDVEPDPDPDPDPDVELDPVADEPGELCCVLAGLGVDERRSVGCGVAV